jgi:hypothetical protein
VERISKPSFLGKRRKGIGMKIGTGFTGVTAALDAIASSD